MSAHYYMRPDGTVWQPMTDRQAEVVAHMARGDQLVSRPVVVIDPEDNETLDLLADMFSAVSDPLQDVKWTLRLILREFANPTPPKPDEPKGLGAVVEDAEGVLWVRTDRAAPWSPIKGVGGGLAVREFWRDLSAVRVLSEGVTEDGA